MEFRGCSLRDCREGFIGVPRSYDRTLRLLWKSGIELRGRSVVGRGRHCIAYSKGSSGAGLRNDIVGG